MTSVPDHSRVTQSRNQADTGGHAGTHRPAKSSTEGHWRSRQDTSGHDTTPVRDSEALTADLKSAWARRSSRPTSRVLPGPAGDGLRRQCVQSAFPILGQPVVDTGTTEAKRGDDQFGALASFDPENCALPYFSQGAVIKAAAVQLWRYCNSIPNVRILMHGLVTLRTETAVTDYHLRQVYTPERNVMRHLILDTKPLHPSKHDPGSSSAWERPFGESRCRRRAIWISPSTFIQPCVHEPTSLESGKSLQDCHQHDRCAWSYVVSFPTRD